MPSIIIETDVTAQGTKISVDGKDITKAEKIVDVSFWASASYKSKISGETVPAYVSVRYSSVDDQGLMKTTNFGQGDPALGKIGKVKSADEVTRFVGHTIDKDIETLSDQIIAKSQELKRHCPTKEVLTSRCIESLKDTAGDLGIILDSAPADKKE